MTQAALAGDTVTVEGTSLSATTDSSGNFTILDVPLGSQVLVVTNDLGNTIGTVTIGTVTITVSSASGSTDSLSTLSINTSQAPPSPPPLVKRG
jgi:hypothetical protein